MHNKARNFESFSSEPAEIFKALAMVCMQLFWTKLAPVLGIGINCSHHDELQLPVVPLSLVLVA